MRKKIKEWLKDTDKKTLIVYSTLRALVILIMIIQILQKNWEAAFLCILTLILFLIPMIIDKKLKIELPTPLEITILLFIFSAEILGEIQNFYGKFEYWDLILHTINGFLCGAIGFSLIDILNRSKKLHITLSPIFVSVVAFSFSMTIGILWEFFEYGADRIVKLDMQKDKIVENFSSVYINPNKENVPIVLNDIDKTIIYYDNGNKKEVIEGGYLDLGKEDTMEDLFVNFVGATGFSLIGYLYIKNRDKYKIVEGFIPTIK